MTFQLETTNDAVLMCGFSHRVFTVYARDDLYLSLTHYYKGVGNGRLGRKG